MSNGEGIGDGEGGASPSSMIQMLYSDKDTDQLKATQKFRKLLCGDRNASIEEIVQKDIVRQLVSFLGNKTNAMLQLEAAWTLTHIGSEMKTVIEAGAVPIFIELLSSPQEDVQKQSLLALSKIANDSNDCRDMLFSSDVLMHLLQLLSFSESITIIRSAVSMLSNLCGGNNQPAEFSKVELSLPVLALLMDHTDVDVLSDTCWAISYLSDGPNNQIQAVIDAGVCQRLVDLLLHPQQKVTTAALFAVGNIATGNDHQTQVILSYDVLACIRYLLCSSEISETIIMKSCWTISNIAAGSEDQIQAIIDAGIFLQLMNIVKTADFQTRMEVAYAISHATIRGTLYQIHYLVHIGCVPHICNFLTVFDLDIVQASLTALENILKAGVMLVVRPNPYAILIENCGGLDKIELLQTHVHFDVYQKSLHIIEHYFNNDNVVNIGLNHSVHNPMHG